MVDQKEQGGNVTSVPLGANFNVAVKYLEERGFTPEDVQALGIKIASRDHCLQAVGQPYYTTPYQTGLIIPYGTGYNSIRWVGSRRATFGDVVGNKAYKMLAPSGEPELYVPPTVNWDDWDGDLYVCESALKAAAMAKHGYAAVAGNGVRGVYFRDSFAKNWPHHLFDGEQVKNVIVLFDADWAVNADVLAAVKAIGAAVSRFYPKVGVWHKQLVSVAGEDPKIGLDDAIVARGGGWLHGWLQNTAEDFVSLRADCLEDHYAELNDMYTVCIHPCGIINKRNSQLYTPARFTQVLEAPRIVEEQVGKRTVEVNAARKWLELKDRPIVHGMAYRPGDNQVYTHKGDLLFNQWKDTGVEPIACDPQEIEDWFLRVYRNAVPDAESLDLLINSMAYILQNRGCMFPKTFLLVGSHMGTGKSLFATIMGKCVGGTNYATIGEEDFTSDFNGDFATTEFVLLDDMYSLTKRQLAKLNRYVTEDVIRVNTKGVQQYSIENHSVYFITSNEYTVLPLSGNDRRIVTIEFDPTHHHPTGSQWWNEFFKWLESGGYGKVRHYLESLVLPKDFSPTFLPPITKAKRHITQSVADPMSTFAADLQEHRAEVLGTGLIKGGATRRFITNEELWYAYLEYMGVDAEPPTTGEITKLGHAMGRYFKRANAGRPIKVAKKLVRLWALDAEGVEDTPDTIRKDLNW